MENTNNATVRHILLCTALFFPAQLVAQPHTVNATRTAYAAWEKGPHVEGDTIGIGLLNDLTVMYIMRGHADSALATSLKAIALGERALAEVRGTPVEMVVRHYYGSALDLGANTINATGDPVQATHVARMALENARVLKDRVLEANALHVLSRSFRDLGFDSLALVWHERYSQVMPDTDDEALASTKLYHANILHSMGRRDTAMIIIRDALRQNDPSISAITHMELYAAIATIYLQQGAIDSAEHYVQEGRRLLADVHGAASYYRWDLIEAQFDILQNRPASALRRSQAMDSLGRSMEDFSLVGHALRYKAMALGMLGRPLDALIGTYDMEANIRREYGVERMQKMALAHSEMAHENELKLRAAEIRERKQDRDMALAGFGAAVVVALSLFGLVVQARRSARHLRAANAELTSTQGRLVQVEHERATEAVRTRIARDIHDDLGAELTRLSMISDELRREGGLRPVEEPLIGSIAEGARRINHLMSDVVWAVDPGADTAQDLIDRVRATATRLVENANVDLRLDLVAQDPALPLRPEVKRDIQLLVKEAINNALKYASARTLVLTMHLRTDGFTFSLKDDGVGFKQAREGGHGVSNMQARAMRLGGTLEILTPTDGGTVVAVAGSLAAGRN